MRRPSKKLKQYSLLSGYMKSNMHQMIMDSLLFSTSLEEKQELQNILAESNLKYFFYKGEVFIKSFQGRRSILDPTPIPEHLKEKMDIFLLKRNTRQSKEKEFSNYIRNALNLCEAFEDIRNILPTHIFTVVEKGISGLTINPSPPTLTNEQISAFHHKNSKTIKALNERILTNILLQKS